VPVKLAHGTDIEELVGSIRDIMADGDCARGDLYLLKSHESFATIIEMAETMPSNFGISISFMNAPEPVKGSDMEPDGDEDDATDGIDPAYQDDIVAYAARVCELYSADLVANPATGEGNGLFSQPMSDTNNPEAPAEETPVVTAPEVVAEPVAEAAPAELSEEIAPEVVEEKSEEKAEEKVEEKAEEASPEVVAEPEAEVEAKAEIPAPAELSRSWNAVSTDLAATRTELSKVQTELSQVQTDLAAARGEIATKDAQLVELNMLHRSVLSVMGLSASIEIPEIVEEAAAMSIIEKYESMPAGAERLSFFQANRREIERSIAAKLK
jgi:outer membrane biosynthesis protein TonB